MFRFQRINGVRLDNTNGLPTVQRTPEGIAMGAVPGWLELLDPDYCDPVALTVRNRARSRMHFSAQGGNGLPLDTFPGNATAFAPSDGVITRIDSSGVAMDPTRWSFFAVVMPSTSSSSDHNNLVRGSDNVSIGEDVGLRIQISRVSGALSVLSYSPFVSPNPIRIGYSSDLIAKGTPTLVMLTFSTRDGLSIFENGVLVAQNVTDKRPLTQGWQAGNRAYLRGCRGLYGMIGMLNLDLGWYEHTAYRQSIEQFLLTKYGIAV